MQKSFLPEKRESPSLSAVFSRSSAAIPLYSSVSLPAPYIKAGPAEADPAFYFPLRLWPCMLELILPAEPFERFQIFFRKLEIVALLFLIGERGIISLIREAADRVGHFPFL